MHCTFDEELKITSATPKNAQGEEAKSQQQLKEKCEVVPMNYTSKVTTSTSLFDHIFASLTNATPLGAAMCKAFLKEEKM